MSIASIIDLPRETYEEAAKLALNNKDGGTVELSGREWMYAVNLSEDGEISDDGTTITGNFGSSFNIAFLDIFNFIRLLKLNNALRDTRTALDYQRHMCFCIVVEKM